MTNFRAGASRISCSETKFVLLAFSVINCSFLCRLCIFSVARRRRTGSKIVAKRRRGIWASLISILASLFLSPMVATKTHQFQLSTSGFVLAQFNCVCLCVYVTVCHIIELRCINFCENKKFMFATPYCLTGIGRCGFLHVSGVE